MWRTNEVVKFDESHYRILFFQSGEIIWINMEETKGVPSLVLEEQLSQWIDEKRLFRSSDPFEYLKSIEPPINSVAFEKRAQAYQIIEPIIYDKGCFNEEIRAKRVRLVEQKISQLKLQYTNISAAIGKEVKFQMLYYQIIEMLEHQASQEPWQALKIRSKA